MLCVCGEKNVNKVNKVRKRFTKERQSGCQNCKVMKIKKTGTINQTQTTN